MVSTRRKSYAPGTQGEGTEPNGTTPGLSTRRSFNSESEVSSMAQQSTPARRSRRLSNSSAGNSDDNASEIVPLSAKRRKRGELPANSVNTDNSAEAKDEPKLQPIDEREESAQSAAESEIIADKNPQNKNSQDGNKTGNETTKSESASPDTKTDAVSQKADNNNQTAENEKSANQENTTANGNVMTSAGTTQKPAIPRGRPKSGRVWKEPKTNPRTMYKDRGMKMPLEKVLQLKQERQRVKDIQNRMKEEKQRAKEDLRRRQEINKKKREENEKKGEVVQVIRNSNKLKRMKKKQLKLIQKRDTTSM